MAHEDHHRSRAAAARHLATSERRAARATAPGRACADAAPRPPPAHRAAGFKPNRHCHCRAARPYLIAMTPTTGRAPPLRATLPRRSGAPEQPLSAGRGCSHPSRACASIAPPHHLRARPMRRSRAVRRVLSLSVLRTQVVIGRRALSMCGAVRWTRSAVLYSSCGPIAHVERQRTDARPRRARARVRSRARAKRERERARDRAHAWRAPHAVSVARAPPRRRAPSCAGLHPVPLIILT